MLTAQMANGGWRTEVSGFKFKVSSLASAPAHLAGKPETLDLKLETVSAFICGYLAVFGVQGSVFRVVHRRLSAFICG
jgi:hypothetical protein